MILGQILTSYKNIEVNEFIKVTNNKNNLDYSLPILIVGKHNAKEIIGENNLQYLNRKVNDNLFWTFGKTERRDEFEKDIKKFNELIINRLINDIKYQYINIFNLTYSGVKELLTLINKKEKKTYLIIDNTIYLYYDKNVYGLSLNETKYIGIENKKILKRLGSNVYNKSLKNHFSISKNIRNILKNKLFLVPYIYFLEKDEEKIIN